MRFMLGYGMSEQLVGSWLAVESAKGNKME